MGKIMDEPGKDATTMAYDQLNRIYPDSLIVGAGEHRAWVGGVNMPWAALNIKEQSPQIIDSLLFASFQNDRDYKESPWKIHLSVHPDDIGKAWDIGYPLLLENDIPCFKATRIVIARTLFDAIHKLDDGQLKKLRLCHEDKERALQDILRIFNGMQITIYIEEGKEKQYNQLLAKLEPLFYQAGVRPGVVDKSDRTLGLYSSVRHVGATYTSYDQVSGYKSVQVKDLFKQLKPVLKNIGIDWNYVDYARHIVKAQITLQYVLDAKRQCDLGLTGKPELMQACGVALDYFSLWHSILKKIAHQSDLLPRNKELFLKFKYWIDEGKKLTPGIRENNAKKIKEAADIIGALAPAIHARTRPFAQRKPGMINLSILFDSDADNAAYEPQLDIAGNDEPDNVSESLPVQRSRTFAELKAKSLPQISRSLKEVEELLKSGQAQNPPPPPFPDSAIEKAMLEPIVVKVPSVDAAAEKPVRHSRLKRAATLPLGTKWGVGFYAAHQEQAKKDAELAHDPSRRAPDSV